MVFHWKTGSLLQLFHSKVTNTDVAGPAKESYHVRRGIGQRNRRCLGREGRI